MQNPIVARETQHELANLNSSKTKGRVEVLQCSPFVDCIVQDTSQCGCPGRTSSTAGSASAAAAAEAAAEVPAEAAPRLAARDAPHAAVQQRAAARPRDDGQRVPPSATASWNVNVEVARNSDFQQQKTIKLPHENH